MFVIGPQPLVSQIGKLVITWMIQTTPYGRRKKGPWSVLNRDSETKAVLYFSHHQFYKHWSCCPNLESRILFSVLHHHQYRKHSSWWQQLSKPWVKDVVFRINKDVGGKGANSDEEWSTVPHQILRSRVSQRNQKSEFCFATKPTGFHRLDEPPEKFSAL